MNYYQEAKQPLIKGDKVRVFERDKIRQDIADFAAKLISEQLELNSKKGDSNG